MTLPDTAALMDDPGVSDNFRSWGRPRAIDPAPAGPAQALPQAEDPEVILDLFVPPPVPPPQGRRGRKKRVLQELLQEEMKVPLHDVAGDTVAEDDFGMAMAVAEAPLAAPLPPNLAAELRVPDMPKFMVPAVEGLTPLSPTTTALLAAVQRAKEEESHQDGDYLKLAQHLFHTGSSFHLSSTVALAAQLGINRYALAPKLCRLMCAHQVLAKMNRNLFEQAVTSRFPSNALVFYLDYASYDETPLKASLKGEHEPGGTTRTSGAEPR